MPPLHVYFRDTSPTLVQQVKHLKFPHVTSTCGNLLDLATKVDVLVTAGNAYGIMDDGIDRAFRDYFGTELEDRVQETIEGIGKAPIGKCIVVPMTLNIDTKRQPLKFIFYVPTMKEPGLLSAKEQSIVPYMCFRSIFQTARLLKGITTIGVCGLGTGIGGVSESSMVEQLRRALRDG